MDHDLAPEFDEDDYAPFIPTGDPALRTLVGLVDIGAAVGVKVGVNCGGQVIEGQLISSVEYAHDVSEVAKAVLSPTAGLSLNQFLLTLGDNPGTEEDDPDGFLRADFVHLRTAVDPSAKAISSLPNGGLWYWRGSLPSIDAWWLA